MDNKVSTSSRLLTFTFLIAGVVMIGIHSNWWTALGSVFLSCFVILRTDNSFYRRDPYLVWLIQKMEKIDNSSPNFKRDNND